MANFVSNLDGLSIDLQRRPIRLVFVRLIPILLTAALVGCATNAQHRASGELTSKAQAPKPAPAPVAATQQAYQPASYEKPARTRTAAGERMAPPQVFKDVGAGQGQEGSSAQPELFGDEAAEAQQEDQASRPQQFTDQAGPVTEEKPFGQQPFVDDDGAAKDDGTVNKQHFTDDAMRAKDEDSVAQRKFTDEAPLAKDDALPPQQSTDDAAPVKDEPVAHEHFADDPVAAAREEGAAPEVFKDDSSGTASEELVRAPETFDADEKLAEAEEPKVPAATMLPMTITVEADPLFDFDQYAIRPESRKKLDDLVQQLRGVPYGEVITVGFADPIGTKTYNQSLSQRRAASVQQYLVRKGIPADKVRTEARGATEEYASYQSCDGHGKQNLIDCLQPDRRVEVTVTAVKEP